MLDWIAAHAPWVILGVAVVFGVSGVWGKNGRSRRVLAVVFGVAALVPVVVWQLAALERVWIWALSLLPGALVVLHGIHVAVFKNRRFFEECQEPDFSNVAPKDVPFFKALYAQERSYYSTTSLMLRFALPALVLTLTGLVVGYSLFVWALPEREALDWNFVYGAQIGAMGAYIAVLLSLGSRAFRCDVTRGSVVSATMTMVVGPVLAGSLQILFIGEPQDSWSTLLLPFAAGFSLRYIVDFVEATIRRVFAMPSESSSRRVPLGRLRGITADVEERLIEEGIGDVATLAAANPVRLRRNTPFDRRQILAWIDEAILMTYLPNAWQNLEADGITGALDLAWYGGLRGSVGGKPLSAQDLEKRLEQLAGRNKLNVGTLRDAIRRMAEDVQVRTVQRLREYDETVAGEEESIFRDFRADADEAAAKKVPAPAAMESVTDAPDEGEKRLTPPDLEATRKDIYVANRQLFLVHTWRRSATPGQAADIVLRLVQHRDDGPLTKGLVGSVTYQLGPKFFDAPLEKNNVSDAFCLRVSAWGPFLCIARVTFVDGTSIDLERYVDFDARVSA